LTVQSNIRVTGKLTSPSDVRAKTDLREVRSLPSCLVYVRLLCNEIDENKQSERRDNYTAERINSYKVKRKLLAHKDACFIGYTLTLHAGYNICMGALADHNARVACPSGGSVLLQVTGIPTETRYCRID